MITSNYSSYQDAIAELNSQPMDLMGKVTFPINAGILVAGQLERSLYRMANTLNIELSLTKRGILVKKIAVTAKGEARSLAILISAVQAIITDQDLVV